MNEETHQKLMTIKRSFRLLMNGPGSQSMRDKGLGYKLNWGVPFYELKKMAEEYGKDYDLAIELWKEDIRECKILATLVMPADKMLPEITDLWMEQVQSQEMAEMLAFNLLQHVAPGCRLQDSTHPCSPGEAYSFAGRFRWRFCRCSLHDSFVGRAFPPQHR